MWILILTISLKSQFNHALDTKYVQNLPSKEACERVGQVSEADLLHYNSDTKVTISCVKV